jgi:hypothetical protein
MRGGVSTFPTGTVVSLWRSELHRGEIHKSDLKQLAFSPKMDASFLTRREMVGFSKLTLSRDLSLLRQQN